VNTRAPISFPILKARDLFVSRLLTRDDLTLRLFPCLWRQAKEDLPLFNDLCEPLGDFSITDMAAVAIATSMADEFGEAFDIPRLQYALCVAEYIEHLAAEKKLLAARRWSQR